MNAASHMSDVLQSLLRFAKLGPTSLQHDTVSLSDIVDTVVSQLPVERQTQVRYAQLSTVTGDRTLLTVVMQNLIENGLKYVQNRSPQVIVQSETTSRGTHVMVIDNGIGVNRKQLTRIFEPGVRGVSDSEFAGSGFGLATCARIVTAHQGEIWAEPNAEGGSTFHFTIP
jgi:light-regulated signal transduction histidine kinase (bacteriophytochrome)